MCNTLIRGHEQCQSFMVHKRENKYQFALSYYTRVEGPIKYVGMKGVTADSAAEILHGEWTWHALVKTAGSEAAFSGERGNCPWAKVPSGNGGPGIRQFEPPYGVKRTMASERGGSPWAKAPSGNGGGGGNRTPVREAAKQILYTFSTLKISSA